MKISEIKKGAFERGYVSLHDKIYRWPGIVLAKLLLYTPITANQVTVLGVLVIYLSAALFAVGKFWYYVAAIFLLFMGEVIDYTDGNIARVRKCVTVLQSTFLCKLYHAFSLPIIFTGIGFGVYRNTGNLGYLLLGFSASFFQLMITGVEYLRNFIKEKYLPPKALHKRVIKQKKFVALAEPLIRAPLEYLKEILIMALIFNKFTWLLIFYGIFTPIKLILFLVVEFTNFKKLEKKLKISE